MGNRSIATYERLSNEAQSMIDATNKEDALHGALIVTAAIEKAIVSILGKHFSCQGTAKTLFGVGGALGSVSACADLSYCLGFISKGMLDNIIRIYRVRNRFAHSNTPVDFNTAGVADSCKELTLPQAGQYIVVDQHGVAKEIDSAAMERRYADPRERFTFVGVCTFFELLSRLESIVTSQKRSDHWDR